MTLYTDGDAAPGGRFCFHFTSTGSASKTVLPYVLAGIAGLALIAAIVIIVMRKAAAKKRAAVAAVNE
ncbi:MAG: hypothetical protein IKI42_04095 [Clostridia bacterium]|nr:hypothetical protein [Clostridia bacterium]